MSISGVWQDVVLLGRYNNITIHQQGSGIMSLIPENINVTLTRVNDPSFVGTCILKRIRNMPNGDIVMRISMDTDELEEEVFCKYQVSVFNEGIELVTGVFWAGAYGRDDGGERQ